MPKRQNKGSSMIHSARPSVLPMFSFEICWVLLDFQTYTDGRTTRAKTMITTGRYCGPTEWINYAKDTCEDTRNTKRFF